MAATGLLLENAGRLNVSVGEVQLSITSEKRELSKCY